jgi:hypothetical protein
MTPEQISAIAGALLALIFEYFPKVSDWYNGQDEGVKRQIMLGLMVLAVGGAFGLSCAGLLNTFVCTWMGAWDAVLALVAAIMANQGVHLLTKRTGKG